MMQLFIGATFMFLWLVIPAWFIKWYTKDED